MLARREPTAGARRGFFFFAWLWPVEDQASSTCYLPLFFSLLFKKKIQYRIQVWVKTDRLETPERSGLTATIRRHRR